MRAADPPSLRPERRDRRLDHLDFRQAEQAALARVRVEPGDRQPRLGDSVIALKPAKS
jgi:hypothetical protein